MLMVTFFSPMKTKKQTKSSVAWTEVYRGKVAGLAYYDAQQFTIKAGDKLELFGEPTNIYDRNAIRVEVPGKGKIGYIPREETTKLHALRRNGAQFRARVVSWNKDNPSWTRCIMLVEINKTTNEANDIKF